MWEGVGDRTKTATYWPRQPLQTSPCVVLILLGCSTGGLGAQSLWDMFSFQHLLTNWSGLQIQSGVPKIPSAGWWLSLPHLVSNSSDLQLTDFLSSPSYIIVQSPTQSLKWKVSCSSQVTFFRCISLWVYHGILPCPIFSAKHTYAISSHNCHRNVSLSSGASLWNAMFGRVEGQYTTLVRYSWRFLK